MVSNLRSFFCNSLPRRLSAVIAFVVSALLIFPPQAFCLITNLPGNKDRRFSSQQQLRRDF